MVLYPENSPVLKLVIIHLKKNKEFYLLSWIFHQPFITYISALQTQILITHQHPVHAPLASVLS